MYFPVVHSGQNDLLALREIAADVFSSSKVVPVIIPVTKNAKGLRTLVRRYNRSGQPFCLVVNPVCCAGTMSPDAVATVISDTLSANQSYYPTLMVDAATTKDDVDTFRTRFAGQELAFFHRDEIQDSAALQAAATWGRWHLLDTDRRAYMRRFSADTRVMIEDPFRKVKNANYPEDESYSDAYAEYREEGYAGFGDYQTIGREYAASGFTPKAVALHLTYVSPQDGALRMRHFVSEEVRAAPEVAARYLEAQEQLIEWVGGGGRGLAETSVLRAYEEMNAQAHYPGLGIPKKLGIRHHLELIMSLL
jgi:hypothetical protein